MDRLIDPLNAWAPRIRSVFRIVVGVLYFLHGTQKIFQMPFNQYTQGIEPWTLNWFAGMLETIGSPFIILGLFTRPVAFLLSGEMAIAYFLRYAFAARGVFPVTNGGEIPVLYCFIFLYFAFAGAGEWSVDAMIG